MRRRTLSGMSTTGEPLSLDSLLDTLMNVVGLLLVMLAVAQLQLLKVKQDLVVDAIPANIARLLEAEREQAPRLADRHKVLQDEWGGRADGARVEAEEHRALLALIATLQGESDRLRALQARLAEMLQAEKRLSNELPPLTTAMQDLRGEIDRLQQAITTAQAATTIHLPVQSVLNKQLDAVRFVCRHGRVYPWDQAQLREVFTKAVQTAAASFTPNLSANERINRLLSHFKQENVGNQYFRLQLQAVVEKQEFLGFQIVTVPQKKEQGETIEEALKPTSQFVRAVKQVDPTKQFVRFVVWSDSFDHYLTLRQKVERLHAAEDGVNTRVGLSWAPYAHDEELDQFWDVLNKSPQGSGDGGKSQTIIDNRG